jgi:hypothetical protein
MIQKFDPFEHENLFYKYKLKITDDEINQVLFLLKNLKLNIVTEQLTTYTYLNVLNFPILKNLKKQVTDILDKHKFLLRNNWAQLYNKKHKASIHNHPGSHYSGIIYVKGENSSPTIFYSKYFSRYCHKFENNTLLLFPSMTAHEVESLEKDEERLIISFNVDNGQENF